MYHGNFWSPMLNGLCCASMAVMMFSPLASAVQSFFR